MDTPTTPPTDMDRAAVFQELVWLDERIDSGTRVEESRARTKELIAHADKTWPDWRTPRPSNGS